MRCTTPNASGSVVVSTAGPRRRTFVTLGLGRGDAVGDEVDGAAVGEDQGDHR
jgi:hypothetical protein